MQCKNIQELYRRGEVNLILMYKSAWNVIDVMYGMAHKTYLPADHLRLPHNSEL